MANQASVAVVVGGSHERGGKRSLVSRSDDHEGRLDSANLTGL